MPCENIEISPQVAEQKKQKLDLPQGIPPLTSLYLYISDSCNLACRHCWIKPTFQNGVNNGQHIKLSYVHQAIKEAKPLGLRHIKLTGGEPTLHPRFRELITLIDNEALNIIIETNGTLIDKELAKFLKGKSHISFISVSLDGASAETHDALRGVPGSYGQALAGIRHLIEVGFRPQLICTLHKGNVSQIEAIIKLTERLGCGSVKFNLVQQVGRGEVFAKKNGLKVTEIIQLYRRVENEMIPKSKIRIHFDIPFAFNSIHRFLHGSLGRCTVLNILGMLATGELSLCGIGVTVPELIFGHMANNNLREVWCESSGLIRLREQIPAQLEGICSNCLHRDICLGNCIANNFYLAGRLNAGYGFCEQAETQGLFPASRKKQ